MSIRLVRQVEAGYRFVGTVDSAEAAARLVESGLATMKGSGRNAVLVMKEEVAPSGGGAVGQGGVKYTYRETYSRGPLHVLKRCVGGKYERWDNDLTFDELRRGKVVSQQAKDRRREMRSMRGGSEIDAIRAEVEAAGGSLEVAA